MDIEISCAADNGGTARGYLGSSLRCLHGQPQLQAVRPAVYLFIAALEVNVLNCREEGRPWPSVAAVATERPVDPASLACPVQPAA